MIEEELQKTILRILTRLFAALKEEMEMLEGSVSVPSEESGIDNFLERLEEELKQD